MHTVQDMDRCAGKLWKTSTLLEFLKLKDIAVEVNITTALSCLHFYI